MNIKVLVRDCIDQAIQEATLTQIKLMSGDGSKHDQQFVLSRLAKAYEKISTLDPISIPIDGICTHIKTIFEGCNAPSNSTKSSSSEAPISTALSKPSTSDFKLSVSSSSASPSVLAVSVLPKGPCLYVLMLEANNYYIGITENLEKRLQEHCESSGSAWTHLHAPIGVVEIKECPSPFDEDAKTKEYMLTHGITKVRGGSYTSLTLSEEQITTLITEIRTATKCCFVCGHTGHMAKACESTTWRCYMCKGGNSETTDLCLQCGEPGFLISTDTDTEGEEVTCYKCGLPGHTRPQCVSNTYCVNPSSSSNHAVNPPSKSPGIHPNLPAHERKTLANIAANLCRCVRCGRKGHTISTCNVKRIKRS